MESLANNNGFVDGNKRTAFAATDVFLRVNGFYIDVTADEGYEFIVGSMERQEFRFPLIVQWIRETAKPLQARGRHAGNEARGRQS